MIDWDGAVLGPVEGVFGEPVMYMPVVGQPFQLSGVFDEAYKEITPIDIGMSMTGAQPVIGVRASAFPSSYPPAQRDKLTRARTGLTYVVSEVQSDGHGWLKLMLKQA